MIQLLSFAIKYRKYLIGVLAVLSVLGALWAFGSMKHSEGYQKAFSKCEAQKAEALNDNIEINKRQGAVIAPSDRVLVKRLRGNDY